MNFALQIDKNQRQIGKLMDEILDCKRLIQDMKVCELQLIKEDALSDNNTKGQLLPLVVALLALIVSIVSIII